MAEGTRADVAGDRGRHPLSRNATRTAMGDPRGMSARRATVHPSSTLRFAAATAASVLLAGCQQATALLASAHPPTWPDQTGPAIQIGGGTGPAGPWTGWLYPTTAGVCVDLVDPVVKDARTCSSGSVPFDGDIGVGATSTATHVIAVGSTARQEASVAVVSTADGAATRIAIVRPGGATAGNGYFMFRGIPGVEVVTIAIIDAAGTELASYPMGSK